MQFRFEYFFQARKAFEKVKKRSMIFRIKNCFCSYMAVDCQTAHCGRGKSHFIFGGLASPIVPYRNLTQTTDGITADCRSLV